MQIRFDHGPFGAAMVLDQPMRLIEAHDPAGVWPALQALEHAREAGYWLAGYVTYEAGYALEPKLHHLMPRRRRLPLVRFGVYEAPLPVLSAGGGAHLDELQPLWDQTRYQTAFDQVKQAIGAGEIYQANLTFPVRAGLKGTAPSLYEVLQRQQPVQYGALVQQAGLPTLVSRSPELFFRTDGTGRIETRPMKGTSPRHGDPVRDKAARDFLHNDEKNRAENLMIVDLLRNDLSRVARRGTVHVPDLFAIESYATVHQMVSTVAADLAPGIGLGDIFAALFPCGSITGAPKIKAMQILRRLEHSPREIYCGSIGWAAPDGSSQFNVAIRTLMCEQGQAVLNVGGGVVWDSTAASEYEEALWKMRFARRSLRAPG